MKKDDFFSHKSPLRRTLLWLISLSVLLHLIVFIYFSLQEEEESKPIPKHIEVQFQPTTKKTLPPAAAAPQKTKKTLVKKAQRPRPVKKAAPAKASSSAKSAPAPPKLKLTGRLDDSAPRSISLQEEVEIPDRPSPSPTQQTEEEVEGPAIRQQPSRVRQTAPEGSKPIGVQADEGRITPQIPSTPAQLKERAPSLSSPASPSGPSAPAPRQNSSGIKIEGEAKGRAVIYRPRPPILDLDRDVTISLRFRVLHDGSVDQILPMIKGDSRLEQAAIDLLSRYRFEPIEPGAAPQEGVIRVTLGRNP